MSEGRRRAEDLRAAVGEGERLFAGVSEMLTAQRPPDRPADGWCAREMIGHLIDSACNNHRRFIINQTAPLLQVDRYAQNEWVDRGRYAETPAAELVALWAAYNRQIARLIEAISDDVLTLGRGPMAERRFPYIPPSVAATMKSDRVTLGHLVEDYVGHIRHHLRQIESIAGAAGLERLWALGSGL